MKEDRVELDTEQKNKRIAKLQNKLLGLKSTLSSAN